MSLEQIKKAEDWYKNHTTHVDNMVSYTTLSYPPSTNEDINNPMLWKPNHWKWFLETYCLRQKI